jgi:hypothetical protein
VSRWHPPRSRLRKWATAVDEGYGTAVALFLDTTVENKGAKLYLVRFVRGWLQSTSAVSKMFHQSRPGTHPPRGSKIRNLHPHLRGSGSNLTDPDPDPDPLRVP